jgi:DNA polymerase-1
MSKRILINEENVKEVIARVGGYEKIVLDTETTGLDYFKGDRIFAIQICAGGESYYFNFQRYEAADLFEAAEGGAPPTLDLAVVIHLLEEAFFRHSEKVLIGHNIIFDVHMLEAEGIRVRNKLEDTLTRAQILNNSFSKYSLADCVERIGLEKGGDVMEFIEENGCYKQTFDPWSGEMVKNPDFTAVPFRIMSDYGFKDVEITLALYEHQEKQFEELRAQAPIEPRTKDLERGVASIIVNMERDGIRVDRDYAKRGLEFERDRSAEIAREFEKLAGVPLVDSVEGIGGTLEAQGVVLGKTPDGNPSMANWFLEEHADHPLVKLVLEYRDRTKRGNTYFANILRYSDESGFLHASFRPRGAYATGRMSGSRPNLQNITKGETCEFPVRRAFAPRDGRALIELDYAAQEFRLLVEYANEVDVAQAILGGMDPHQATADMAGITRSQAKTMNFGLLYGMGAAKLAKQLNLEINDAKLVKARYFRRLPGIQGFIRRATQTAETRGYVTSWDGCRFLFPDRRKAYQAANRIIQGGCASMMKQAMVNVDRYIQESGLKTLIISQVHDALLLDMPENEFHWINDIRNCMASAYQHRIMPMATSVEYSFGTWYDLKKGHPLDGQAEGSTISFTSDGEAEAAPELLVVPG